MLLFKEKFKDYFYLAEYYYLEIIPLSGISFAERILNRQCINANYEYQNTRHILHGVEVNYCY